jgi:dihydrolipoamide dehydrogenase
MMGHNVTECIHAASALLHERVSLREAAEVIMAHPTMSEAIHEAFEDSLGMALHLPPRKVVRVQV